MNVRILVDDLTSPMQCEKCGIVTTKYYGDDDGDKIYCEECNDLLEGEAYSQNYDRED